jgi:nitrogen regulatory protein PII
MKLVIAIVKPFKVVEIVDAVKGDPTFPGMTVCAAKGFGKEKTVPHERTRREDLHDFTDCSMLLVAVPEDLADDVAETIREAAHTGLSGDGKIFVLDLAQAVRIVTGARGEDALC